MARKKTIDNSEGPATFQRDEHGLLKNIQYSFNEDGSVNWRAMIKDEHLFPNKSWFQLRKKDMPRSIEGLADHQLLIKLSGIKELARLRGFREVSFDVQAHDPNHVAVTCQIEFIPNYETDNQQVIFQDMANATIENTNSFAKKFLETIACNRAFVRCVRNFLQIHIVGDDEIDKSDSSSSSASSSSSSSGVNPLSPTSLLKNKASEVLNCDSFEDFRKVYIKQWWQEKVEGIYQNESIKSAEKWEDIPGKETRILIGLIKK